MLTKDLRDTIEEMAKRVVKHLGGAKALHDFTKGKVKTEYVFGEPNSDDELAKAVQKQMANMDTKSDICTLGAFLLYDKSIGVIIYRMAKATKAAADRTQKTQKRGRLVRYKRRGDKCRCLEVEYTHYTNNYARQSFLRNFEKVLDNRNKP